MKKRCWLASICPYFGWHGNSNGRATVTGMVFGTPHLCRPNRPGWNAERSIDAAMFMVWCHPVLLWPKGSLLVGNTMEIIVQLSQHDSGTVRKIAPEVSRDLKQSWWIADDQALTVDTIPPKRCLKIWNVIWMVTPSGTAANWSYRIQKKIRKHKAVAGILAASTLLAVNFRRCRVLFLVARRAASEVAQEFAQTVENMQWQMHVLPGWLRCTISRRQEISKQ